MAYPVELKGHPLAPVHREELDPVRTLPADEAHRPGHVLLSDRRPDLVKDLLAEGLLFRVDVPGEEVDPVVDPASGELDRSVPVPLSGVPLHNGSFEPPLGQESADRQASGSPSANDGIVGQVHTESSFSHG